MVSVHWFWTTGQPVIVSGHGSNQPSHQWLKRLPLTKMLMRWTALGLRFGRMARFPGGAACENTYRIILIEFDAVHVAKCTSMGEIHLLIIIDPIIFCSISFRFFQIMQKMTCHEDLCFSISKYPQPTCAPSPPTSLSPSARPSHFASKGGRTLRAARWMNFQSLLPIRPSCHELGNLNTRKTTHVAILDKT